MVRGVEKGERLVIPSLLGRAAWTVSRLAPALYERIMVRAVAAR